MKGLFTLLGPLKTFPSLQQLIEWTTSVSKFRNKSVQRSQHAGQYLYFLLIAQRFEVFYSANLVGIQFYSSVSDHVPEELASPHTKGALVSIEMQLVPSEYFKYIREVANMPLLFFAFHHLIIIVYLHRMTDLLPKHSRHHPLISGPCIL